MSLVQQIHRGALGRWFATRMPGTRAVTEQVRAAAARVHPVRPPARARLGEGHWTLVGGVVGSRIGALVEPCPPYYALTGLVGAGLVGAPAAHAIAAGYPTHRALTPEQAARALDWRPAPTGWCDLAHRWPVPDGPGRGDGVFTEFAARAHRYTDQHAPTGTLGTRGAERGLARVHTVWALCEELYRSGAITAGFDELLDQPHPSVEQLRALAPAAVVDDATAVIGRLHTGGALGRLRQLAGDPAPGTALGHAGPVLVDRWADADLLVAGTLIDVKTVLRADDPQRVACWLWQLIGYAWLDRADRYRIHTVGLYLARHGLLLTWPLERLTTQLATGGADPDTLREEFGVAARAAELAERATLT